MSGVPSHRGRVGSVINGKWQVDARIGSGGMSTVYAATHKNNGSRAALKILHADLAREPEIKSRFLREGYVGNQVRHHIREGHRCLGVLRDLRSRRKPIV